MGPNRDRTASAVILSKASLAAARISRSRCLETTTFSRHIRIVSNVLGIVLGLARISSGV